MEGGCKGRHCPWSSLFWSLCSLAVLREEERERKEKERRKEKKRRKEKNRKKIWKIFQTSKFLKNKR
jgi:hypothetical protein